MSKIEAAASLFGSSDSGSDFFTAPEGGDSRKESPANASSSYGTSAPLNDDPSSLFENTGDSNDAAFLFSGDEPQSEAFGDNSTLPTASSVTAIGQEDYSGGFDWANTGELGATQYDYPQSDWNARSAQQDIHAQHEPAQNQYNFHPASETSSNSTSTPWSYDANGQNSTEEKTTNTAWLPEQSAYSPGPASVQQSSDPYRPIPAAQQHESPYVPAAGNNNYDLYKPAAAATPQTPSQSAPYSTQQEENTYFNSAGTNSTYDPYKPSQSSWYTPSASSTAPQSQSTYASAQASFVPTSVTQKPPAAPYRPASSNAYDPPISIKKRSASVKVPATSYSTYNTNLSPPAPPRGLPQSASYAGSSLHSQASMPPPPPPPPSSRSSHFPPPGQDSWSGTASSINTDTLSFHDPYGKSEYRKPPDSSHLRPGPAPPPAYSHAPPPSSSLPKHPLPPPTQARDIELLPEPSNQPLDGAPMRHADSDALANDHRSDHDITSPYSYDAPLPNRTNQSEPIHSNTVQANHNHDPYNPDTAHIHRIASPERIPVSSYPTNVPLNHSPPVNLHTNFAQSRERSFSGGHAFESSRPLNDLYAPFSSAVAQVQRPSSVDNHHAPTQFLRSEPLYEDQYSLGHNSFDSQRSIPTVGPYAPSPSLLGTNDPLGRSSGKAPVISFGFGGKLITCFHASPGLNTGFDVALSARKRTDVNIRIIHKTIPESILDLPSPSYPGPLFGDPGSPVTAIMRTTTSTTTKVKAKKDKVLAYLSDRDQELANSIAYHGDESDDRRRAEGKLALVRLIRVLVENDGQLHGSSACESAVRIALLPRTAQPEESVLPDALHITPLPSNAQAQMQPRNNGSKEALQKLQELLLRGEKQKAYNLALDEKLFAHALVIASGIDKDAFKEAVNEFIRSDIGVEAGSLVNGFESLRLAYSLFSGQPSTAVQHLVPTKSLQTSLSVSAFPNHVTPMTPNFPQTSSVAVPDDVLSNWQEYAAMLFSNQSGTGLDSASALSNLGDCLSHNGWVEAAHCCYILSPQSSPIGGVGAPNAKIVLVGSECPQKNPSFSRDCDAFILSEILEFALSLRTPAKGQEPFSGFPHLQVYRFVRALQLAELGYVGSAKRYCEAILNATHKPSPYLGQQFLEVLGELTRRLNGDPELDKANSWIGGKISKPSLDSIGDWLGGTLSKFVAGDAENSSPVATEHADNNPAYAGAFSHYSTITSTNPSRVNSPAPSFTSQGYAPNGLPPRSGSAAALYSSIPYPPINRSSSAMAHGRPESRKNTPPPRLNSADATTTTFMQSQSFSQAMSMYGATNGSSDQSIATKGLSEEASQESGWWSAAYGDSSGTTPTATSFVKLDEPYNSNSSNGFISLMDDHDMTPSPSLSRNQSNAREEEEEEDLGFGNSSSRRKVTSDDNQGHDSKPEPKHEAERKEDKNSLAVSKPATPSSSGSWLGRWFTRSTSASSGPVNANLGEENTFYYDKELKRWVNKNAAADTTQHTPPPPPPPRAQTASPSRAMPPYGARNSPPPPSPMPPYRPQSAMDSMSGPPRGTGIGPPKTAASRLRANLGPEDAASPPSAVSAPPTPAVIAGLTAAPPTGRPKSAAARKNVRSRYVDVFQQ